MIPQVSKILDYWFLIETEVGGKKQYCLGASSGNSTQIFKSDPIVSCNMGVVTTTTGSKYGLARANPGHKEMVRGLGIEYSELDPIPERFWTKKY
jgi:hypothetical protein